MTSNISVDISHKFTPAKRQLQLHSGVKEEAKYQINTGWNDRNQLGNIIQIKAMRSNTNLAYNCTVRA